MNPQPAAFQPPAISVTEPVSSAYERVKQILFRPFNLAKWVTIGFCAWLAGLGQGGTGGSFNGSSGGSHGGHMDGRPVEAFRHFLTEAGNYVAANLFWILPLAGAIILAGVVVWGLVLWLSSRGQFMFLHCVALDRAEVAAPWMKFRPPANSLFWFRVCLALAGMVLILPFLVLTILVVVQMVSRDQVTVAGVILAIAFGLGFIFLAVVLSVIRKFLVDFVVPIMFLRGGNCLAAWREFVSLLVAWPGQFALYLLFQIVLNIIIGAIVFGVILLTCCLAGCLMILPFIGTVVLLPVLVFKRAYPLYYLAQYGPQYISVASPSGPASEPLPPPVTA
jgi:hypothetical protein